MKKPDVKRLVAQESEIFACFQEIECQPQAMLEVKVSDHINVQEDLTKKGRK